MWGVGSPGGFQPRTDLGILKKLSKSPCDPTKHFSDLTQSLGWKAPRNSVQMVYPDGLNKDASDDELNLSFKPSPNYAQLAEAAAGSGDGEGWIKGLRVVNVAELRRALKQAHEVVGNRRGGILIEALMERTVS